jgi:hypothetical protein
VRVARCAEGRPRDQYDVGASAAVPGNDATSPSRRHIFSSRPALSASRSRNASLAAFDAPTLPAAEAEAEEEVVEEAEEAEEEEDAPPASPPAAAAPAFV